MPSATAAASAHPCDPIPWRHQPIPAPLQDLLQNVTLSRGGVLPAVNKALQKQQKDAKKSSATPSA